MSTAARLAVLSARGREATAARRTEPDTRPRPATRVATGEPCPECGGAAAEWKTPDLGRLLSCPDCGDFARNGNGGWSRRGHSGGVACRELLALAAPLLPDMPGRTVLDVERDGERVSIDATDDLIAAELRGYIGTLGQWLESRAEWLRGAEVHDG